MLWLALLIVSELKQIWLKKMFNMEYNLSPSYLVYPISASNLAHFPFFLLEIIHHHHFSCKSPPVRSKFDIMVLQHNFCILVIISLPFLFFDMSSTGCLFFGVPEDDSCGGCFVTWEAYTCRVYFFPCS